tara:strand:+ start:2450 stop:3127 length:678 start_codon:yes stop_codon:yes gene_type:complete
MAFLQLKKQHHLNNPIVLELLQDPASVVGEARQFDGKTYLDFSIEAKNKGLAIPTQGEESYKINPDNEFDFKMSETLYKKINDFQKNENVYINMKTTSNGRMVWDVRPATSDDVKSIRSKIINPNKKEPMKSSREDDIRWGMAFNNATRLVAQTTTSTDHKDMVDEIKRIIPYMFQVACGMEKTVEFINNGFKKPSSNSTEIPEQPKEQTLEELEDDLFGGSGGV